jgi:hypothetical protein
MILSVIQQDQYRTDGLGGQSPRVMISGGYLHHPIRGKGWGPAPGTGPQGVYFNWNLTVTVKTTGRGRPLMIIGS